MKHLETIFVFIVLTTMTLFVVVLIKMVNEPGIQADDVKAIMDYNSTGIR